MTCSKIWKQTNRTMFPNCISSLGLKRTGKVLVDYYGNVEMSKYFSEIQSIKTDVHLRTMQCRKWSYLSTLYSAWRD